MKWNLDTAHSEILFTIRHMMISKVRGQFEKFSANVNFDLDHPENTTVLSTTIRFTHGDN